MSVKVTGINDEVKKITDFAIREMNDFTVRLQPILFNRSPMGPSEGVGAGIKRSWKWDKVQKKGSKITGGMVNDLPYVDKINSESLRHLDGMKGTDKWERSFGTELGKPRAAWARRVYGTDTRARRYGRGYRRAMKRGQFEKYKTEFIEQSIQDAGGWVSGKVGTTYFVDIIMKY